MKKFTLGIFFLCVILNTQAQDYLISFTGEGDTNAIETIKVENLMSGDSVSLKSGDVLHLTGPVGIGVQNKNNLMLKVYPNPLTDQSMLTFATPDKNEQQAVDLRIHTVKIIAHTDCRSSIATTSCYNYVCVFL